jgi:hypothetical protein
VESSLVLSPTRFLSGLVDHSFLDNQPLSCDNGIVNLPIDYIGASPWPPRDEVDSRGKLIRNLMPLNFVPSPNKILFPSFWSSMGDKNVSVRENGAFMEGPLGKSLSFQPSIFLGSPLVQNIMGSSFC